MGQPGSRAAVADGDWLTERPRLVLLAATVISVLVLAIVAISGSGSGTGAPTPAPAASSPASAAPIPPTGLSAAGLSTFVRTRLKQPVYWAGPGRGDVYELQRLSNGSAFIRYLGARTQVGDPRSIFLLIATYPYPSALERLKAVANGSGRALPGGGYVLQVPGRPTNFHLAFPGIPYEIEVYDPSPAVARLVAESGQVRAVR